VPVVRPDVSAAEFAAGWRRIPVQDRLLMWTVLPAVLLARLFGGTRVIWSRSMELNDLPMTLKEEELNDFSPELAAALSGERDERLVAALCRLHEERGAEAIEVAVVYGAAHTTPVVLGLMKRYGYRPRSADWLTIVDL
jgi:pheromone shutdown protein TraB